MPRSVQRHATYRPGRASAPPGPRSRYIAAAAITISVLLVLTGCSWLTDKTEAVTLPTKAGVGESDATIGSKDGAITVHVPKTAVGGPGTVSLTDTTSEDGLKGWTVSVKDTNLTGDATIRFKMPDQPKSDPAPLIMTRERPQDELMPVESKVVDGYVVVTTRHFSGWFVIPLEWVRDQLVATATAKLDELASLSSAGKQPKCPEEKAVAKAGFDVASDSGRRVYWCLGKGDNDPGAVHLETVNGRGHGVVAEYSAGLRPIEVESSGFENWLAGQLINGPFGPPPIHKGNKQVYVPGAGRATFAVDQGQVRGDTVADVAFRADPGPYLISAARFAVDMMVWLLAKGSVTKVKIGDKEVTVEKALERSFQSASCFDAFAQLASARPETVADASDVAADGLTLALDCVKAAVPEYDLGSVLENEIVQFLMLAWSGLLTAATGAVAAVDLIIDIPASADHRGPGYHIWISGPEIHDTVKVVIDPFTDGHDLLPGWKVTEPGTYTPVDCSGDYESMFAIGPGTHHCGGTADSTAACWATPIEPKLYCFSIVGDPDEKELFTRWATNLSSDTSVPEEPRPMFMILSDGSEWSARIGGAWPGRADGLNPVYGCRNDVGLCANSDPDSFVLQGADPIVDTSSPAWTVEVGPGYSEHNEDPEKPVTMAVTKAWFIK